MRQLGNWHQFTQRSPLEAATLLVLLFAAWVIGFYALDDMVYDKAIPGAMAGTIIALYLAATFVLGLTTPLRVGSPGPAVGFCGGAFLWPLTPRGSNKSLTYDSGWAGAVLYTRIQAEVIWLVARFGANLGGRQK